MYLSSGLREAILQTHSHIVDIMVDPLLLIIGIPHQELHHMARKGREATLRLGVIILQGALLREVHQTHIRQHLVAHILEIHPHNILIAVVILLHQVETILHLRNPAQQLLVILVHLPLKIRIFPRNHHQTCLLEDPEGPLLPIHMLPQ